VSSEDNTTTISWQLITIGLPCLMTLLLATPGPLMLGIGHGSKGEPPGCCLAEKKSLVVRSLGQGSHG
jgi:hypothetical protein